MINEGNQISDILNSLGGAQRNIVNQNSRIDKDSFLKLLFTQLKYQDFESSVDYKDLLSQLSILAQIEQSMNVSRQIQELAKSVTRMNFLSASAILGKNAFVDGDALSVSGGVPESLPAFSIDIPVNRVIVKIKAQGGLTVRTIELNNVPAGKHFVSWDGKNDAGNTVQEGEYTFEVQAYDSFGNKFAPSKLVYGKIDSITLEGTSVKFGMGKTKFEFEKVTEVKE